MIEGIEVPEPTMSLYTVYDRLAQESGPVFEAKNDAVAMRGYRKMLGDNINPEEYRLLKVGKINHRTQELTPIYPSEEILG